MASHDPFESLQDDLGARPRRSSRERKMTQKGRDYAIARLKERFYAAVSEWQGQSRTFDIMKRTAGTTSRHQQLTLIEDGMKNIRGIFMELAKHLDDDDGGEAERIKDTYMDIENKYPSIKIKATSVKDEDRDEKISTHSRHSKRSKPSTHSGVSRASSYLRKMSAEAAAAAAELKCLQEESAKKLEFQKLKSTKKLELEMLKASRRLELEQMEAKKRTSIAKAKLDAVLKLEDEDQAASFTGKHHQLSSHEKHTLVEEYLRTLPDDRVGPTAVTSVSTAEQPTSQHNLTRGSAKSEFGSLNQLLIKGKNKNRTKELGSDPQEVLVSGSVLRPNADEFIPNRTPCQQQDTHELMMATKVLVDQLSLSRLPAPEPGIFTGDVLKFPAWKAAFQALIESRGIPMYEAIHYLKKYLGGAAKEVVEGYFYISTDEAYGEAMMMLEERFGDPFQVATAFRSKLEKSPKVQASDGVGQRKLADFLRQCLMAMTTVQNLDILNDMQENQKILKKLPDWIITRWARHAQDSKDKYHRYPPFEEFVLFMKREADLACDPVTSIQAIRRDNPQARGDNAQAKKTTATKTRSFKVEAKEKPAK